ncbi:MAG: hypothetical protein L0229_23835 [Blastocatellia bacterium]|nr:hypothetical protein [Blastocatellia bacterium]
MAEPAFQEVREAPAFKVLVDGSELPVEIAVDILDVAVSDYVQGANTFTVRLNNWDSDKQEFKGLEEGPFVEGAEVEVKAGFVDNLKTMIQGEVTALEPEFHEDEVPTLKVTGYDLLHHFRRGRKTRSFINMKDSQIAQQIASELQLAAEVEDSQVVHEYVLQDNMTDIDFLLKRASFIRYEVTFDGKTLKFRKAANDKAQVVSLEYGFTLKSFYPRLSTMRQVSEVIVQGWDPKTKRPIKGRARQGDETTRMGGTSLGVEISEKAFFKSSAFIVDRPVFSDGEATQIAKGKFNDMAVEFISGEGMAIGNTDIRAGRVIELKKLGKRFSGLYYVTSSTHMVDQKGYATKFTGIRSAT